MSLVRHDRIYVESFPEAVKNTIFSNSLWLMSNRTLVLLKPDAVERGLVGDIVSRFEKRSHDCGDGITSS